MTQKQDIEKEKAGRVTLKITPRILRQNVDERYDSNFQVAFNVDGSTESFFIMLQINIDMHKLQMASMNILSVGERKPRLTTQTCAIDR